MDLDDRYRETLPRRVLIFLLALSLVPANCAWIEIASRLEVCANVPTGLHWNWFGKIASLLFSGVLLAGSPWLRRNVGLRWIQAPGSARLSIVCFVAMLGCALGIGFLMPSRPFSIETLLFQFAVPAIDEELIFRGIILALLERSFGQNPMSCRLRWGYASLVTSVLFALPHAIDLANGHLRFSLLVFAITVTWAAVVALVRTRSGSLLWPVLIHGAWDGTIFLVAMLR